MQSKTLGKVQKAAKELDEVASCLDCLVARDQANCRLGRKTCTWLTDGTSISVA